MTRQRAPKARILTASILFIAVFTVLIAFATSAQQRATGQPSAKASAASLPSIPAQGLLSRPPLKAVSAQRIPPAKLQGDRAVFASPDSGNPLFLPSILYSTDGYSPSSVAVADVNGDGKPDLVVTNQCAVAQVCHGTEIPESSVGVLLANGDGTFQPVVIYSPGGAYPNSVAIADVNGDGKPDVIVASLCSLPSGCDGADGAVGVLLGNGDGTFRPAVAYDSGGIFPGSVTVADVNGDGKPDLVVANLQCSGNSSCSVGSVGVLLGNGDGTFQPAVTFGPGGYDGATSVAVADLNGDGKPDLVVTNNWNCPGATCGPTSGTVGVLLGNGDGTFQPALTYNSGGEYANSVAVADVNGDGKPDLVVANLYGDSGLAGGTVGVLLGNGDGTFQPAVPYDSGGFLGTSVAVADVNGDGKPDLLVYNQCVSCAGGGSVLGVLWGNGDGTFQTVVSYNFGGEVNAFAVADVNGDGRPDVVATEDNGTHGEVGVLLNNTGPHTPTTTTVTSSTNPAAVNDVVTYTATVAGKAGAVTGTVTFYDGGAEIGVGTLASANDEATYSTSYGKRGTHAITATYSGDIHNSVSTSATLTEDIAILPILSTTAVTTSGSPSFVGQPVTFTATVTWQYGTVPNGGLVTFYEGTRTLGSVALAGGLASYKTSSLTLGTHFIKATYSGDVTFRPSSGTVTQVIDGYPTSTTLISSLNPSIYGQTVTWTVRTTTSGAITPTGEVSLKGGGYAFGPITLNASGVATLTKSMLNVDSYPLAAVYAGNATYAGSTSAILTQVVTQAKSFATLTSSPNPSTQGQAVTFTATISSPTVRATGPVTFAAGTTVLGTAQLSGGKAKFTTSTLAVGSSTVKATYYGDSNIAESSASVKQTVQP